MVVLLCVFPPICICSWFAFKKQQQIDEVKGTRGLEEQEYRDILKQMQGEWCLVMNATRQRLFVQGLLCKFNDEGRMGVQRTFTMSFRQRHADSRILIILIGDPAFVTNGPGLQTLMTDLTDMSETPLSIEFGDVTKGEQPCVWKRPEEKLDDTRQISGADAEMALDLFELFQCPLVEPTDAAAFYSICNPITGTNNEKLQQLNDLSSTNTKLLDNFFKTFCTSSGFRRVSHAEQITSRRTIQCKWNKNTKQSTLEKSVRPTILEEWPEYGLEHIRDSLRFKAVVFSTHDAFQFLSGVINSSNWTVVKLNVGKVSLAHHPVLLLIHLTCVLCTSTSLSSLRTGVRSFVDMHQDCESLMRPTTGWRFIGADIKMSNGQLVECYGDAISVCIN
jgi:hypothetical protein